MTERVCSTGESDIDRKKLKYLEKNLFQCHFLHLKFNMAWPGIEPEPPMLEAGN